MTGLFTLDSSSRSIPIRGGFAVVVSVLANVVLVVGVDAFGVAPGFRALTIPPVAFLSAVGAGGATGTYWLLRRSVRDADRTFVRIAGAVLLFSFVPDIALLVFDPAATPLAVGILLLMHIVVAAVSVGSLVFWRLEQ